MKGCLIFTTAPFSLLIYIFALLIHLPQFHGIENIWYASCGNVYNCGAITGVDYPFYGEDRPEECGYPGLELDCDDDIETTIDIMGVSYLVLSIDQDAQILTIAREDLLEDICLEDFVNTTLDSRLFEYASENTNLTFLYGCPPDHSRDGGIGKFKCRIDGIRKKNGYVQMGSQGPGNCHASVVVPVKRASLDQGIGNFVELVASGFEIKYKVDNKACNECKNSSGICRFDQSLNQFTCLSLRPDEPSGDDETGADEPTIFLGSIPEPPPVALGASGSGMHV